MKYDDTESRDIFERIYKYIDEQKKALEENKDTMFTSYLGE